MSAGNAALTMETERAGSKARRAALLLHGISADDRAWLLGELSLAQRTLLEALLAELRALGVPPSPELIDDIFAAGAPSPALRAPEKPPVGGEAHARALEKFSASSMADLLRGEPDALVAHALQGAELRWRRAVLGHLGFSQRRRIEEFWRTTDVVSNNRRGRRLDDAVLAAVVRRAEAMPPRVGILPSRLAPARFAGVLLHWKKRNEAGAPSHTRT